MKCNSLLIDCIHSFAFSVFSFFIFCFCDARHLAFALVNIIHKTFQPAPPMNIDAMGRKEGRPINSGMMTSSNGNISALLALCAGKSPMTGEFPAQRPVTWSFDVFFDLPLNNRLSKQWWGWWFETPSCPLWRHSNGLICPHCCAKMLTIIPCITFYQYSPKIALLSIVLNESNLKLRFF